MVKDIFSEVIAAARKRGDGPIIHDYDSVLKLKGHRYAKKFIKAKYAHYF